MAKAKKRRGAKKKDCKCGKVKGRNKCRKPLKGGKGGCPKRPRKRRRGRK